MKVVLELCGALGIAVGEAAVDLRDLGRPSELLLVGTGFGVAGVRELAVAPGPGRTFDWPGPVYARLRAAWQELTRRP